jgi:branched-chain amino acid transport system substrate-binding protein
VFESAIPAIAERGVGVVTSYPYSVQHPSALNQQFIKGMAEIEPQLKPTIMAVAAYDAMAALYSALKASNGKASGSELMEAFKGWHGRVRVAL